MKRSKAPRNVTVPNSSMTAARLIAWRMYAVLGSDEAITPKVRVALIRGASQLIRLTTVAPSAPDLRARVSGMHRIIVQNAVSQAKITATPALLERFISKLDLPHKPNRRQIRRILATLRREQGLN